MQNRTISLIIAALLPLLLFGWFAQSFTGQVDFWLLWLVAMLGVGLPLLFAEIGMAHRSGLIPAAGMQTLTRESDTSIAWRGFSWVATFGALVLAALSVDRVSTGLVQATEVMGFVLDIPVFAIGVGMMVIATLLSLLGRVTAVIGLALLVVSLIVGLLAGLEPVTFQITQVSLIEWARAVALALITVGVGTGLYWFNAQNIAPVSIGNRSLTQTTTAKVKLNAAKTVLPIWITQIVVGSIAFMLSSTILSPIAYLIYSAAILMIAGYLLYYATSQLAVKFGTWIALLITLLVGVALVVVATPLALLILLTVVSLISGLLLAIFAGWKMKISHMRKSLNFGSEGTYSVWRIAVRVIAPLMIIIAIIGWIQYWLI